MTCPTCKRAMVELFTSTGCDWCDFGPKPETVHRGFIVHAAGGLPTGAGSLVFRTRIDAERWREQPAFSGKASVVLEVYATEPYRWRMSRGVCSDSVVLADACFEIFPDHRYEPLPHRAFIAPARKEHD